MLTGKLFLDLCTSCLQRDFDTVICLNVVEMAAQMAAKGKFDKNLASRIFSVEFLDRIDDEIEIAMQSKDLNSKKQLWYPNRLRQAMMNLNRLTCILFPEFNVPWFHEKYCIEFAKHLNGPCTYDRALDPIREDVYQTLCSVAGGCRNVRENVFSPYYHFLDFEVWLDTSDVTEDAREEFCNLGNFMPIGNAFISSEN